MINDHHVQDRQRMSQLIGKYSSLMKINFQQSRFREITGTAGNVNSIDRGIFHSLIEPKVASLFNAMDAYSEHGAPW